MSLKTLFFDIMRKLLRCRKGSRGGLTEASIRRAAKSSGQKCPCGFESHPEYRTVR